MKYFRTEPGERVVEVKSAHLTELQNDGRCDACNRELKAGARVVGKVIEVRKGMLLGARFSPTCLVCADLN
jgi:hypothetical protein